MNIKNIIEQFYDYSLHMRGYSKATIKRYKFALDYYIKITGITKLQDATKESVQNVLYYGKTERNWSVNTTIVIHKSLLVFFRWCFNRGYISFNPVVGIDVPALDQRIPTKLSKQEALRLLEVIDNYPYDNQFLRFRNHAIFSMFIFCGLRKGELINLHFRDVDLANMTVLVRLGKGRKDRIIPMSYTLATSLRRYIEVRKMKNKTCPEFFVSYAQNRGITDQALRRILEHITKASGIKFSFHKLRHTFATLMLEGGCDLYSLSKMMGHSDIKTTTIYLAATAEHLREQIGKHPLNVINGFI